MTSPQASPYILGLDSPQATLDRVGGKGASLARMAAAGLPVPPGFHITTDAYRRDVDENHLGDAILSAAGGGAVHAIQRGRVAARTAFTVVRHARRAAVERGDAGFDGASHGARGRGGW